MKQKIPFMQLLLFSVISALSFVLFSGVILFIVGGNTFIYFGHEDSAIQSIQPLRMHTEFPMVLTIPKINVSAQVEYVGITSDGSMGVPNSLDRVAWFDRGPYPGEVGSAVMAGHFGWKDNKSAVFDHLYKLRTGDRLYVEDQKGSTTVFVVQKIRRYDSKADASNVFNSNDGKAHLNLITCDGVWSEVEKSYSSRLVIFADKEIEQ